MHAGIRLERDKQYTLTFPNKIHISSAMICTDVFRSTCLFDCLVEVHLIDNGTDHLIGILGGYGYQDNNPVLQCNINLKLDPTKSFTFYVRTTDMPYFKRVFGFGLGLSLLSKAKTPLVVQLVGCFDSN